MKIVCISASQTVQRKEESTSTKVCGLVESLTRSMVHKDTPLDVEIIPLMAADLKYCRLCGKCADGGKCPFDPAFNRIYASLSEADVSFWVVPHYSPLPSKLMTLMEKLNEIFYAGWIKDPSFQAPVQGKKAAVIGHGGMTESPESLKHYHNALIAPVANTLRSFGLKVVGLNDEYPSGAPFGLKNDDCIKNNPDEVFPDILEDWGLIRQRIEPLVEKVLKGNN
ncbi:MAG: NAD(P)H-dependent oxidoreductase [Clostridia bacterium]|nr:NAD(P)H-dependent oxidoreductase [Clostridia bacterium]